MNPDFLSLVLYLYLFYLNDYDIGADYHYNDYTNPLLCLAIQPTSAAGAKTDAENVAKWLKGKKLEYPVFFDVEDDANHDYYPSTFSEERIMEIAHTFMTEMVNYGYYPGLYTNNKILYNTFNDEKTLKLYDVWYARYPGEDTDVDEYVDNYIDDYSSMYSMWQYLGDIEGLFNGAVSGACDLNYAFKDYPAWIKQFGFNGYGE